MGEGAGIPCAVGTRRRHRQRARPGLGAAGRKAAAAVVAPGERKNSGQV